MPTVNSGTPLFDPLPDDILEALRVQRAGAGAKAPPPMPPLVYHQGPRPRESPPGLEDLDARGRVATSTSTDPPNPTSESRVNTPPPAHPVNIFRPKLAKTLLKDPPLQEVRCDPNTPDFIANPSHSPGKLNVTPYRVVRELDNNMADCPAVPLDGRVHSINGENISALDPANNSTASWQDEPGFRVWFLNPEEVRKAYSSNPDIRRKMGQYKEEVWRYHVKIGNAHGYLPSDMREFTQHDYKRCSLWKRVGERLLRVNTKVEDLL